MCSCRTLSFEAWCKSGRIEQKFSLLMGNVFEVPAGEEVSDHGVVVHALVEVFQYGIHLGGLRFDIGAETSNDGLKLDSHQ